MVAKSCWIPVIVVLFLCSSCRPSPNSRFYAKGNIELIARLRGGQATYNTLLIGAPGAPFDTGIKQYANVLVELPNKEILPLSQLNVDTLRKLSNRQESLDELGYDSGWPKGSESLDLDERLVFIVNNNRILQLYANTVGNREIKRPPRFGTTETSGLFSMPFNQEQVTKLFGAPDSLKDVWHK